MPVLKANTITDAKFGNTDLSAVYRGSTRYGESLYLGSDQSATSAGRRNCEVLLLGLAFVG